MKDDMIIFQNLTFYDMVKKQGKDMVWYDMVKNKAHLIGLSYRSFCWTLEKMLNDKWYSGNRILEVAGSSLLEVFKQKLSSYLLWML